MATTRTAAKEVVVMPAANRPELLALALEGLANAHECPDDVRIFVDHSAKDSLEDFGWVRDNYFPTADLFLANPHIKVPSGCWNILNSIKQGYETGADIIYLIEEDVRVKPDYFPYAKAAIAAGYPAALGRETPMNRNNGPVYTNPGSALSRATAEKLVPHINDDYFQRLRAYLDERFGAYPNFSDLDDGLIRRVILADKGECAVPKTPKATHLGFYFYNKLDIYKNHETVIQNKIERARELFRTVKAGDKYSRDFESF
jgi:hypothetical protein